MGVHFKTHGQEEAKGDRKHFYFASDLHGREDRYLKLLQACRDLPPFALLLGGDLLPRLDPSSFIQSFLLPRFLGMKRDLGSDAPLVGLLLGNDDPRIFEDAIREGERSGAWTYLHFRAACFGSYPVAGYSFVPPTPFLLKDWERYDVSRFIEPGAVPLEEGRRTVPVPEYEVTTATIREDLENFFGDLEMKRTICLFHAPPYDSNLDRAGLDGKMVDHAPVDVHVGSIAVRRFIEQRQPLLTLHGHVHESATLTGSWRDRIGRSHCFSAAYDGPELALVIFHPENLEAARRELL